MTGGNRGEGTERQKREAKDEIWWWAHREYVGAQELKGTVAEGRVGYADLIALGGAYAVKVTGGPDIPIKIGEASKIDPDQCILGSAAILAMLQFRTRIYGACRRTTLYSMSQWRNNLLSMCNAP